MRVFAFAFETEAPLLYALRSKAKLIFPNHVRNFQNQELEATQIFNQSIKKFSFSMLIPIARFCNLYRSVNSYGIFNRLEVLLLQSFKRQQNF